MPPIGTVGIGGVGERVGGPLVVAAHQGDLRQGVVDGTSDLGRAGGRRDGQRAVQRLVGGVEASELDVDLAQSRQRLGQPVRLPDLVVERHRPLGQRDRLVVAAPELRHGGLVHVSEREDVLGAERRRQPFGVAQRRGGVVVASLLGEHHPRHRVHLGQVPAIAGGVERGGGFGEVLADDRVVADFQITVDELEVGEPDAARVVGRLRVLEGAAVQGDGPRLLAEGVRDAAMQSP
jgi:hypothetical protein